MKYNKKHLVLTILFFILLIFFVNSCKRKMTIEIEEIWGRVVKVKGVNKSNFSAFGRIINRTPAVEGEIGDWSFKLYAGNTLLFDVNKTNYKSLNFNVTVSTPVNYMNGTMVVMMGLPYYDAYIDYVDEDILAGQKPDKLVFNCTIVSLEGETINVSSTDTVEYIEKEEE